MANPITQPAASRPVVRHLVSQPTSQLWHPRMAAYWPFEGGGKDASGNGRDLTNNGAAALVRDGDWGLASSHDGANDYWSISPSLPIPNHHCTVAAWVKQVGDASSFFVLGRSSTHYVNANNANRIVARYSTGPSNEIVFSNTVFAVGEWTHIAVVFGAIGTGPRVYVNGVDETSTSPATVSPDSWNATYVGRWSESYAGGMIDELMVIYQALLQPDIRRVMHGLPPEEIV